MRQGIVLMRKGRYATVLLAGGEFVRVPAQDWDVGDEVSLPERLPQRLRGLRTYGYAAAGLGAVLALLPMLIPTASAQVVAYTSVDINPSVQLGLGARGQVLTETALDADGTRLLKLVHLQGETLPAAVSTLLAAASHQGYLQTSRDVSVILAGYPAGNQALPADVKQGLRTARTEAVAFARTHHFVGVVSALIVPGWVRLAAGRQHVSVGLYALWSVLQRANVRVPLHSLQGRALGKALAQVASSTRGSTVLQLLSGTVVPASGSSSTVRSGTKSPTGVTRLVTSPANPPGSSSHSTTGSNKSPSAHSGAPTGTGGEYASGGSGSDTGSGHSAPTVANGSANGLGNNSSAGPGTGGSPSHPGGPPVIVLTPTSQFSLPVGSDGNEGQSGHSQTSGGAGEGAGHGSGGLGGQSGDGAHKGQKPNGHQHSPQGQGGQNAKGHSHAGGGGKQGSGDGQQPNSGSGNQQSSSSDGQQGQQQGFQTGGGSQPGSSAQWVWPSFGQLNLPSWQNGANGSSQSSGDQNSSDGGGDGGGGGGN